jgi:hypothetical protein
MREFFSSTARDLVHAFAKVWPFHSAHRPHVEPIVSVEGTQLDRHSICTGNFGMWKTIVPLHWSIPFLDRILAGNAAVASAHRYRYFAASFCLNDFLMRRALFAYVYVSRGSKTITVCGSCNSQHNCKTRLSH